MSFSFTVAGHAGSGMQPTDEDEGQKVKALAQAILDKGSELNLVITLTSPSNTNWMPSKLTNF